MTVEYWFHKEGKDIAQRMQEAHVDWYKGGSNPICTAWNRNTVAYYSTILEADSWESALSMQGKQGELIKMAVPQARSLIRQMIALVTKQRYAFSTISESSATDVVKATRIGNAVVNNLCETENVDKKAERLIEQSAVLGGSFLHTPWRSDCGRPWQPAENGTMLYTGKQEIAVRSVYDVLYDTRVVDWDDRDWVEVRTIKNRWDMIAQFPHLEQAVKALPAIGTTAGDYVSSEFCAGRDDLIYVYEAYHRRSPSMPMGRLVVYSDVHTIYYDDVNPYIEEGGDWDLIPVEPNIPEDVFQQGTGYPFFSNLLPCQEMLDCVLSSIATNNSSCGVQNFAVPQGANMTMESIAGMNWFTYLPQQVPGGGKPEALQLTQSSPEAYKFSDLLLRHMTQLSNLNSTIRGEPPAGLTAGTAIATVTTNALEFLNSFSKSQNRCLERAMGKAFRVWRKFAQQGHNIIVEGKNGMAMSKPVTGADVNGIAGVKIQVSNPLMQTLGGRSDLADKLMQNGLVTNLKGYFRIIDGAPPSEIYGTELSESDLESAENDAMMEGKPVIALSIDDHPSHIRTHSSLLNDPDIRMSNERVAPILQHIMEHAQLAQQTDPMLMAMVRTGKMPQLPPPGAPPAPGQGGSKPAQPEGPKNAPANVAEPTQDPLGREGPPQEQGRMRNISPEMVGA